MRINVSESKQGRARVAAVGLSLILAMGITSGLVSAHVVGSSGTLPAGTSISVGITSPADGSLFLIPSGGTSLDVPFTGSGEVGAGAFVQDTTIVYVVDRSGSMTLGAGVDCTGDAVDDSRMTCARRAVSTVNSQAVGPPPSAVDEAGVASFSDSSTAHDVDLGAGTSFLVAPAYDGDLNGVPDVEDVVNTLPELGATCYSCGLTAADTVLGASTNPINLVVFLSDGANNAGSNVAGVGLSNFGANTIIHAFAMGEAVTCTSDPAGLGSLTELAARSTGGAGTCTQVTDLSALSGLISLAIGSTLDSLTMSFNGGAYGAFGPGALDLALPAAGPATAGFATTLAGLGPGTYSVCAQAAGTDAGGSDTATDCHSFQVASSPDCSAATPSLAVLWPPNNLYRQVTVNGVTHPDGTDFTVTVSSIWQDEPVDTTGDGAFTPDGAGVGSSTAQLRAERVGTPQSPGNGRVYHVSFTATDVNGGTCSGVVEVGVPHNLAGATTIVDGGALYDSTVA